MRALILLLLNFCLFLKISLASSLIRSLELIKIRQIAYPNPKWSLFHDGSSIRISDVAGITIFLLSITDDYKLQIWSGRIPIYSTILRKNNEDRGRLPSLDKTMKSGDFILLSAEPINSFQLSIDPAGDPIIHHYDSFLAIFQLIPYTRDVPLLREYTRQGVTVNGLFSVYYSANGVDESFIQGDVRHEKKTLVIRPQNINILAVISGYKLKQISINPLNLRPILSEIEDGDLIIVIPFLPKVTEESPLMFLSTLIRDINKIGLDVALNIARSKYNNLLFIEGIQIILL